MIGPYFPILTSETRNKGSVSFDVGSNNASALTTWSHTCSGANRLLIVAAGDFEGSDTERVTSITYAGVALTELATHAFNTARATFWYLVNPASGANNIIVVDTIVTGSYVASSWKNVNQSVPLGAVQANTGNSTTPTDTAITASIGNFIVDGLATLYGSTEAVNAGQTLVGEGNAQPGNGTEAQMSYLAGNGSSKTLGWTNCTADTRWAIVAVEIKHA